MKGVVLLENVDPNVLDGNIWKGGKKRRKYIDIHELLDIKVAKYGTGNIRDVVYAGKPKSNSWYRRNVMYAKLYIDLNTNELVADDLGEDLEEAVVDKYHYWADHKSPPEEAQKKQKLISIKAQIKKFFEKYLPKIKVDVYPPDESILDSEALAVPDRSISKQNIIPHPRPQGNKFETYEIVVALSNADTKKTVNVNYYLIKSPKAQFLTYNNDYSSLWAVVDGAWNFTNSHEDQNSLLELVKSKLGVGFRYTFVVGDGDGDSEEFDLDQFYWIKYGVGGAVETYKKLREISGDAYIAIRQYGDFEDTDDAFKEYGMGEMDLPLSELVKSDPNLSDSLKGKATTIEFLSKEVVLTNTEKMVGRQLPLRFEEMERKHNQLYPFEVVLMESFTISPNEAYIDSQTDDHDDYYEMQADIFEWIANSKNLLIESKIPQPTLTNYVVRVDEDSNSVFVEAYHTIKVEAKDIDHAKKEASREAFFLKSSLPQYFPLMAAEMDNFENSPYPLMKHFESKVNVETNKISLISIRQLYPFKVELYETLYIKPSADWLQENSSGDYDEEWARIFDKIVENDGLIFDMKKYDDPSEWVSSEGGEGSSYYIEAHHTWEGEATSFKEVERLSQSYVANNTSFPSARKIKDVFARKGIHVEVTKGDILISDIYPLDNNFEDPDEKLEAELRRKKEIEREKFRKRVEKQQFFSQKVKYKKSKDFALDGEWITTIDGIEYDIFRDATSGIHSSPVWYGGKRTEKALNRSFDINKTLGYTKKEATAKLLELIWESKHAE